MHSKYASACFISCALLSPFLSVWFDNPILRWHPAAKKNKINKRIVAILIELSLPGVYHLPGPILLPTNPIPTLYLQASNALPTSIQPNVDTAPVPLSYRCATAFVPLLYRFCHKAYMARIDGVVRFLAYFPGGK